MKPDSTKINTRVWSANEREQSRAEEIANSICHAMALFAVILGTPFLIIQAASRGDAGYIAGASLFCACAIIMYLSSTVYHALPSGLAKNVFRLIDHCAIFLLIAGTYTPFTLGVLRSSVGWILFSAIWGLAAAGVILKMQGKASHPWLSTGLYLLMGWLIVAAAEPLFAQVPLEGVLWLLAGGLFYTAGVAFYATDSKLKYGHSIWHLFVVTGTACHYFAILWYAA
jgi:hemolysin III